MEIWLRLVDATAVTREVAVDLDDSDTLDDLRAAIGEHVRDTDSLLFVERTGVPVSGAGTVGSSDLRQGDTLTPFRLAPVRSEAGSLTVVVAGGPGAGRSVGVPRDGLVVGRGSQADLVLADPTVSVRHARISAGAGHVVVEDLGSSNGTFVNGLPVLGPTVVGPSDVLELGDIALRCVAEAGPAVSRSVVDGRMQFTRRPRVTKQALSAPFDVPAPPETPQKRRLALSSALVPLVLAPVMVAVTHQVSYLAMAALSPVLAIASVMEERRNGGKDHRRQVTTFRSAVGSAHDAMLLRTQDETSSRWASYPDPAELLERSRGPSPRLWERRARDADAFEFRVGWGDLPSSARWVMPAGGDPALRAEAAGVLDEHGIVHSAPWTIPLQSMPVVGVVGTDNDVDETARWMTLQAATLHSPRELTIVVAVDDARAEEWRWVAWLPHSRPDGSILASFGSRSVAVGTTQGRQLVVALSELASRRRGASATPSGRPTSDPTVLVVLDHRLALPQVILSDLLEQGPSHDIRIIWLGDREDALPGESGAIVEVEDRWVSVTLVAEGNKLRRGQRDRCGLALAEESARSLAGIRDATARSGAAGDLPPSVSLSDLLGGEPTADTVSDRWRSGGTGLAAPVGLAESGPFMLDLRRSGPHALLGGTTGAGKSEMLQTIVASFAVHHPPDRLTFLLIDYKGGAAFKDCVSLPHVVGFVTDLSGHLVHRALISLGAELNRRERLLASADAKDLVDMQRTAPDLAPPSLLLVIDEFATLAKELPDFVEGVVNIAQRGRSLGIHLMLATQRPAGAINDNIRANTNLRIALRMNDAADSNDVIGVPLAATLPREIPGRAYVRTAASELTEVQIAYSGGTSRARAARTRPTVMALRRGVVAHPPAVPTATPVDAPTDLQLAVGAASQASEDLGLPMPPSPWLPPLPDLVPLDSLTPGIGEAAATVGLIDLPAEQRQVPLTVDLQADGSLLILGTSGAGKTTLLRTLAASLASQSPPADLNLYALDFASRGLGSLESLPHCGSVVVGDDIERVQRLFGMLEQVVTERRQIFADSGATSLAEYRVLAAAGRRLPRLVVLLDSYAGFASIFEKIEYGARLDSLPHLVSEGRALGIHFVITALRRNSIPASLASVIPASVVLRLADVEDYAAAGLDSRVAKAAVLPPGRGFTGSRTLEVQCAVVSSDPSGPAQHADIARRGALLAERWPNQSAPRVMTLPATVSLEPLRGLSRSMRPVIGLGERQLAPLAVDLSEGHFLVAGPMGSGKSTALTAVAEGLRRGDPQLELLLIAPRRSRLRDLGLWSAIAQHSDDIDALCARLQERAVAGDHDLPPVVVVIDDGQELIDSDPGYALETIARRGRDASVHVVAAVDMTASLRAYGGWVAELRKDRHGVLLQPDTDTDGDLFGVRLPRQRTSTPGRGFLVTRKNLEGVQIAHD